MNVILDNTRFLDTLGTHTKSLFDPSSKAIWLWITPQPIPCYTPEALQEVRAYQRQVESLHGQIEIRGESLEIQYFIVASGSKGVFNYGGNLRLFEQMIRAGDADGLRSYARLCVDTLWSNVTTYGAPITTISLVQGDALGGGLECALSSQVIIAERSAQMGLPEIGFNLFPGMGAYSFLVRRVGPKLASEIMTNRRLYSAEEMFKLGVVDILAEDGCGEQAMAGFIRKNERQRRGFRAIQDVKQTHDPITLRELIQVADIWVKTALTLEEKDLKLMSRLVQAQERLARTKENPDAGEVLMSRSA